MGLGFISKFIFKEWKLILIILGLTTIFTLSLDYRKQLKLNAKNKVIIEQLNNANSYKDDIIREYETRLKYEEFEFDRETGKLEGKIIAYKEKVTSLEKQLKKLKSIRDEEIISIDIDNDSLVILFKEFFSKYYYKKN